MKPCVSLIIVSRNRPKSLALTLKSLAFQSLRNFETIIVTDTTEPLPLQPFMRRVHFDDANISAARNRGIREARASIVAFLDDDAIPDPHWLARLIYPFYQNQKIGAAGGYVRGRNGINYQWRTVAFNHQGWDVHDELIEGERYYIYDKIDDYYVKTIGTNCAFRTEAITEIGGFDEALRFFLDESDVNIRLQQAGWLTAIVPDAQVIHGFLASQFRNSRRVPRSLYEISASKAYFLSKHSPRYEINATRYFREEQIGRLQRLHSTGLVTKFDIKRLLDTLERGLGEGALRLPVMPLTVQENTPHFPIIAPRKLSLIWQKNKSSRATRAHYSHAYENKTLMFVVSYVPSLHKPKLSFTDSGFWLLRIGQYGRGRTKKTDPFIGNEFKIRKFVEKFFI